MDVLSYIKNDLSDSKAKEILLKLIESGWSDDISDDIEIILEHYMKD